MIENLGATQNHFDAINLSDNDLTRLNNMPPLSRLRALYVRSISTAFKGVEVYGLTLRVSNSHEFLASQARNSWETSAIAEDPG